MLLLNTAYTWRENNNKLHSQLTFISSRLRQFQAQNLLTFLACSIILWTQAYDAMKPLKCAFASFQSV